MRNSQHTWAAALAAALLLTAATAASQAPRVNPHAVAVAEFKERVASYVRLHKEVEGKDAPPLVETKDPAKVTAREIALGKAIRSARATARRGDVFTRDLEPFFRQTIRDDWKRRAPADRRALLQELPQDMKVAVNMTYPPKLPLLTFPPKLLVRLPALPDELEYRFFGGDLILRDTKANIIIDYLPNVIALSS